MVGQLQDAAGQDGDLHFRGTGICIVALMGAVPAEFIRTFTWQSLAELLAGAIIFLLIAIGVFRLGLKRYESGSAIQVEV